MGLFSKPVTDKELRDYRRGKPVRDAVAKEYVRRNGGSKAAAKAIRNADRRANAKAMQDELDLL